MRTKFFLLAAVGTLAVVATPPVPGMAQSQNGASVDARVDKLEHEMRAVQRKVFPGGDGKYFPPEITAPQEQPQVLGTPATSPVADLQGRVNALESQMATLTGQVETSSHQLQVLQSAFDAYKRATDDRLKALEPGGSGGFMSATGSTAPVGAATGPAPAKPTPPVETPKPAVKPDAHAAALAAVQKPATADPADDLYVYGFRLWSAKLYPEAEAQLKQVSTAYPKHRRASWAQNLLGRAYLDEGKYKEAAQAFYDNYKVNPQGERTPDSVYYLATALKKLNRPTQDVCKAYDVLTDAYGGKLTPAMTADVAKQRADLKCP